MCKLKTIREVVYEAVWEECGEAGPGTAGFLDTADFVEALVRALTPLAQQIADLSVAVGVYLDAGDKEMAKQRLSWVRGLALDMESRTHKEEVEVDTPEDYAAFCLRQRNLESHA